MLNQNRLNYVPSVSNSVTLLSRRVVLFPLCFFQFYLTATVIVFATGPWPWPVPDPFSLYLYLFCTQLALWLGYGVGLTFHRGGYYSFLKINSIIKISLILNLVWIVPTFMLRMNVGTFNAADIMNAIANGFTNPGANYLAKAENLSKLQGTPIFGYVSLLISPVLWLLVPLAVVYWDRLTLVTRSLFVFFVIADVMSWVAIGTNKGIADYVILLPWLLIAKKPEFIAKIRFVSTLKFLVVCVLGFVLLFSFFSFGMYGRGHESIPTYDAATGVEIDRGNWMVCLLPSEGQGAVAMFAYYLTQGYYALSLAIEEPFISSYGVGNSFYLTGLVERFVGQGVVSDITYPARIEKYGWDRLSQWHSFYVWIASDVSFFGVLVVVFLVGQLFAMVWLDVLMKLNPFAVALFAMLIIMLFYFPANNQVLAFSGTANSFFVFLACWLFTRKRYILGA